MAFLAKIQARHILDKIQENSEIIRQKILEIQSRKVELRQHALGTKPRSTMELAEISSYLLANIPKQQQIYFQAIKEIEKYQHIYEHEKLPESKNLTETGYLKIVANALFNIKQCLLHVTRILNQEYEHISIAKYDKFAIFFKDEIRQYVLISQEIRDKTNELSGLGKEAMKKGGMKALLASPYILSFILYAFNIMYIYNLLDIKKNPAAKYFWENFDEATGIILFVSMIISGWHIYKGAIKKMNERIDRMVDSI